MIINNETFTPFHAQLKTKNPHYFNFNETKKIYTKKNSFHKIFHYQICTLPDEIPSIIATSSCFTMLIFFNKCTLMIGNETIICMPYSIMFIKKGCHYKLQKSNPTDVIFIFDCHQSFFDNFIVSQIADCPIFYDLLNLTDALNEYLLFDYQKDRYILSTLNLFLTELIQYKQAVHSDKNYKLLLVILMSQLDRNHTSYLVIHDSSMMQCYDEGKILKYLSDHFCTATLSSTADYFNFHPAYFSTLFKKLFHESFSKKLLSLKLEHAKRLLITTNLSTTEIMQCVGFNDKSYFFKSFKNYYQITPLQYRKNFSSIYKKNPTMK